MQNLLKNLPSRIDIAKEKLSRGQHFFNYQERQTDFADRLNIFVNEGRKIGFYGGAMGGGKTYVCISIFAELALIYPNSIWTVVRETRERCNDTVVKDFKKTCKGLYKHFNETKLVAYFENGSVIDFKGENIDKDPDLDAWKSYSTNGVFFEQIEEVQKNTFEMALIRTGRNRIDPMPPQIVIGSINPSMTWAKKDIYEKWLNDSLPEEWFYVPALIQDNKYLFDDKSYMSAFERLDPLTKKRYLEGNWDAFAVGKPFIYSFEPERHIDDSIEFNPNETVYFSFDFNIDPMTCVIAQHGHDWIHVLDEIRLNNSNTHEACEHIMTSKYMDSFKMVTGDASGMSRNTQTKGNVNNYTIIVNSLHINPNSQLIVPSHNPPISESRTLTNSLFANHKRIKIHSRCKYLIEDIMFVQVNDKGEIDKTKDKHKAHLIDGLRYYFNTWHGDFITSKKY